MTPAELGAQLKGGKSLKDVAADKGVPYETVSAAVLASVKADLDAAVAAGTIKQARADRILARLEANLADGRLRNGAAGRRGRRPTRAAVEPRRQSKTMTWRQTLAGSQPSNASSRSSRPMRRSISRSIGSRPSRWSGA